MADGAGQDLGPHRGLACQECHQGAGQYPHEDVEPVPCLTCHLPHTESTTGDLHSGVSCAACHLAGDGEACHRLADTTRPESCRRCHFAGNKQGASAAVLPAKGALCLVCHTATLSLPDWPSRLALAGLVLGLLASLRFWLSGSGLGPACRTVHGPPPGGGGRGVTALLLDGLGQRRLWRLSPGRWLLHALMVMPFAARLIWALAALGLSLWLPGAGLTQAMLNKNHPATALFFDLTGLLVLVGAAGAMLNRALRRKSLPAGLPGPDWLGMGLLAGVVLSGFVAEAGRLALTGAGGGAPWAFLGAALSGLMPAGEGMQKAYGWLWHIHVGFFAAFVIYLPLGRMRHILLAPLSLAIRAKRGGDSRDSGRN